MKQSNCVTNRLNEFDDFLSSTLIPGHLILNHQDHLLFDWPCDS